MNRHWDILASNGAATRFFGMLLDGRTPQGAGNILRLMFHPDGLRPCVDNWEAAAQALVRRVHREAVGGALDETGLFAVVTVLGTPQDITLQELRVECFFPLDDATATAARQVFGRA